MNVFEKFEQKSRVLFYRLQSRLLLKQGGNAIEEMVRRGLADERAITQHMKSDKIRALVRSEQLYETTSDPELHQQLLDAKRRLSNAELLALERLDNERLEQTINSQIDNLSSHKNP